jgi:hypothetical protein
MQYLVNTQIIGEPDKVETIKKFFGNVYLGGTTEDEIVLTIKKVLTMPAKIPPEKPETVQIYVLVPDKDIGKIWLDRLNEFDGVKYCTATRGGALIIMQAVAVLKGKAILYLCLPSAHFGDEVMEGDYLGI